jgi:hypothetical protein
MARTRTLLIAVSGLALAIVGVLSAIRPPDQGPAYSVAALRTHLERDPQAWVNRTVRVRASAEPCLLRMDGPGSPCHEWHPVLVDAGPGQEANALPLVLGRASPLLTLLRRLPLAGQLVLPAQAVRWGAVATYRVQLRAAPASACPSPPCYEALLLDPQATIDESVFQGRVNYLADKLDGTPRDPLNTSITDGLSTG